MLLTQSNLSTPSNTASSQPLNMNKTPTLCMSFTQLQKDTCQGNIKVVLRFEHGQCCHFSGDDSFFVQLEKLMELYSSSFFQT